MYISEMLNQIKVYWYKEKTEYEDRYKQAFLKDYEKSIEYLEKMKSYYLKIALIYKK